MRGREIIERGKGEEKRDKRRAEELGEEKERDRNSKRGEAAEKGGNGERRQTHRDGS